MLVILILRYVQYYSSCYVEVSAAALVAEGVNLLSIVIPGCVYPDFISVRVVHMYTCGKCVIGGVSSTTTVFDGSALYVSAQPGPASFVSKYVF